MKCTQEQVAGICAVPQDVLGKCHDMLWIGF